MTERQSLFLILAGLNVLWTPVNLMLKLATAGGMSPAAVAGTRWSLLCVLLFAALQIRPFRKLTRARWPSRRDAALATLTGFLLFGPSHLIYYVAITRTSAIEATVLGTTAPVWTTLMAFLFLRERSTRRRGAAITLGFVGAWIVSIGFAVPSLDAGHTGANLLYLTGVLAECATGVIAASLIRRSSGITVLAFQVLGAVGAFTLAPLALPSALPVTFASVTPAAVAAVAYLVLIPGLLCFAVWYMTVERAPLSVMVLTLLLQPPLSALLSSVFLNEPITAQLQIGTVFILVALVMGATEKAKAESVIVYDSA